MPSQNHLAVDIGAGSGRAFVGRLENGRLVSREIHRFSTADMILHDKRVLNTFRYYEEVVRALAVYTEEHGPELRSIGVDSFSCDFTILDEWGRPVFPVRSYRDSKLTWMEPLVEKEYGSYKLYQRNGNHTAFSDTLQQMLRMREEGDPALKNPHGILFIADLMHYLLGGKFCNEHSMACYTRMYNRAEERWDDEVLDAFRIPRGIKTPVAWAGDVLGRVRDTIARDAGLATGVEIITPCGHDTSSAALSIPDLGDDWAFISSGSWSLVGTETAEPIYAEKAWKHNFSNSTMPLRTNMFKKNVTGMWLMQQCRKSWGKFTDAEIVAMAEKRGETEYCIDVDRREFYAPADMPDAVVAAVREVYGVDIDREDYGLVARICLQSIAMKYRYYLDLLSELSGKKFAKIYIIGGGSRIEFLNQITADVTGIPVFTGVYEGSVTGNLLLQMYGSGELASKAAMRRVVKDSFPVTGFYPGDGESWERRYERYREAVTLL